MIVSKKLKYLFELAPKIIDYDDYSGKNVRTDKTMYRAFRNDKKHKTMFDEKGRYTKPVEEEEIIRVPHNLLVYEDNNDNWDLIHLDGDCENYSLDNLEMVVFVDEDPTEKLCKDIELLKKELKSKNEYIKKISFESNVKDGKVTNMQKQLLYEQNRIKELNKELKIQDKEIRRLLSIIADKKH